MHPFTTTELARTIQAERDAAIRRAVTSPARLASPTRATTPGTRRGTLRVELRVWRLRLTLRFWRLAGRTIRQPGRWVWDPRA